ncbi:MAG: hypothetical protein JRH01_10840 [Deltaproteobacteria bacterium]|nr:hypothetical protein [Deltaproteobacteria bacterium]
MNPVNDAPTAVGDSASVNEGASVTINLSGNDTDPDNALDLGSIVITSAPANGSLRLGRHQQRRRRHPHREPAERCAPDQRPDLGR